MIKEEDQEKKNMIHKVMLTFTLISNYYFFCKLLNNVTSVGLKIIPKAVTYETNDATLIEVVSF